MIWLNNDILVYTIVIITGRWAMLFMYASTTSGGLLLIQTFSGEQSSHQTNEAHKHWISLQSNINATQTVRK